MGDTKPPCVEKIDDFIQRSALPKLPEMWKSDVTTVDWVQAGTTFWKADDEERKFIIDLLNVCYGKG